MTGDYQLPARYSTKRLLGKGAAGEVYLVRDSLEEKDVALKILFNIEDKRAKTFFNEFETLSSLDHPGLIKVFDFGVLKSGTPYFTMEFLEGEDLQTFLDKKENISSIPDIIEKTISALNYLHTKEILHSDIKPGNIMVVKEDGELTVKLLDFGLAASAAKERKGISGTARFLPPEAIRDREYSESSDLYALGMTLVECITGEDVPLYSEIDNRFYEHKYRSISGKLSQAGVRSAYTLASFILDLCRIDVDERTPTSEKATTGIETIIREEKQEEAELKENILVGRDNELQEIEAFISSGDSEGRTLLLEGVRGTGKKRLIGQGIKKAQLSGQLVIDLSGDIHADNSMDNFIEILAENLPSEDKEELISNHREIVHSILEREKSERTKKENSAVIIYDNIVNFIDQLSKKQPVLISIPDIDRFSIDFQKFIIHLSYETELLKSRTRTIISINTDRSENRIEEDVHKELEELEASSIMNIEPLSLDKFKFLVEGLTEKDLFREKEITDLYEKSSGVPLYLIQILRHLINRKIIDKKGGTWLLDRVRLLDFELPDNPDEISRIRYKELKRPEKDILQVIAFYGTAISGQRLNKLIKKDSSSIDKKVDKLVGKGFLKRENGKIRFINPFMRETVRRHTSRQKRIKLNRIIAENLEKDSSASTRQIADHFIEAGDLDKGFKYGIQSADELSSKYEHYDCYDILNRMKKLIRRNGSEEQLKAVLTRIARIELLEGLIEKSIKDYKELIKTEKNENRKAKYYKELGVIYGSFLGKIDKPIKFFNMGLKLAHKVGNDRLRSEIILELSDLIKENKISLALKAAEISKSIDLNIYSQSLNKLLRLYSIIGDEKLQKSTINKLTKLLKKVDVQIKKEILFQLLVHFFFKGEYERTKYYLDQKYKLEKDTNDDINKISTLRMYGGLYYTTGEFHKTIGLLDEAINLNLKYRNYLGLQVDISNISLAYIFLAEYMKAISYLYKGQKIFKKLGVQKIYHRFYGKFCFIYLTLGKKKEKDFNFYYNKTKESALQNNNTIRFGHSQMHKSLFYHQRLKIKESNDYALKALKAFRDTNDRDDIVDILITISKINIEQNRLDEAEANLSEARQIFDEINCKYLESSLLLAEGMLARVKSYDNAEEILSKALKVSRKMGTREFTWQIYRELALFYRDKEDINNAMANFRNSIETIRQITESIDGDEIKTSYLSVPFRKRVFDEIKELNKTL